MDIPVSRRSVKSNTQKAPGFTPGPWKYGEDMRGKRRVFDTTGREVVRALSEAGLVRRTHAERAANAHLIAAAPALYAAVVEATEYVTATHALIAGAVGQDNAVSPVLKRCREALALARGEAVRG